LVGPDTICPDWANTPQPQHNSTFRTGLREYLKANAGNYDVVDYPFEYLPVPRSEFPGEPLFVARSVLLTIHFEKIEIPPLPRLKSRIGHVLKAKERRQKLAGIIRDSVKTFQEADLCNVSCKDDKEELIARGIPAEKIAVFPYGINADRRPAFDAISTAIPEKPLVAFVGTVDGRKGINDLPKIFAAIAARIPEAHFLMLGAGYRSEQEVYGFFPTRLHSRITVQPRYDPADLPGLLSKCTVGVFPSHVEGFGFGVLEMLAAAVPVIAYNAPGPTMMLPGEYLAPRGDWSTMAQKVIALLQDRQKLGTARQWSQQRSQEFSWQRIAADTMAVYAERVEQKRQVVARV
jgi:glycosyltransferase involved in cell wall biosynthesis